MPNFDATIRKDYRDIVGLVLDCRSTGLAADGSLWVNSAPPARPLGTFGSYTKTPRFGNPYQDVVANRPVVSIVSGYKQAAFTKASSHFFNIPLDYSFTADDWTVVLDYFQGVSASNDQTIIGFPNLEIYRRNGAGNFGYKYNATNQAGAGDMTDGLWMMAFLTSTTAAMYQDAVSQLAGTAAGAIIAAADPCGYIGNVLAGAKYSEMSLRGVQMWNRILSTFERDFAHASLDPINDLSSYTRATVTIAEWNDDTGDTPRINPSPEAVHRYYHVSKASGVMARVQISAEVDGIVEADAGLGGELFELTPLETPGAAPAVYEESGWSSIWDVKVSDEGHYAYLVSRPNGGGVVIHFDVEDV